MKKLTKLGIAVFSVVTLNAFTSTIAYADERIQIVPLQHHQLF